KTKKAQAFQKQVEIAKQRYIGDYNKDIIEALETSGLPKTKATVRKMLGYLHSGVTNGFKDIKAKDVVGKVKAEYISDIKDLFSELEGESLLKILGSDIADKIRKYDVNQYKQGTKKEVQ